MKALNITILESYSEFNFKKDIMKKSGINIFTMLLFTLLEAVFKLLKIYPEFNLHIDVENIVI